MEQLFFFDGVKNIFLDIKKIHSHSKGEKKGENF